MKQWGVDQSYRSPGGLGSSVQHNSGRQIVMMQRKTTKPGKGLGKTTGWIHRASLKKAGVKMLSGVTYSKVDDDGLHIQMQGQDQVMEVDTIVVCAGQHSVLDLVKEMEGHTNVHIVGGARLAAELDAKRAIEEGIKLATTL